MRIQFTTLEIDVLDRCDCCAAINTNKRFPVFVANRLTKIEEHTTSNQWRYVTSKENPADLATGGIETKSFVSKTFWFVGPKFLLEREELWPQPLCSLPKLPEEF